MNEYVLIELLCKSKTPSIITAMVQSDLSVCAMEHALELLKILGDDNIDYRLVVPSTSYIEARVVLATLAVRRLDRDITLFVDNRLALDKSLPWDAWYIVYPDENKIYVNCGA
jgi:hypothetical protein